MPIFQENSHSIFPFTEEFYSSLIEKDYLPKCKEILQEKSEKEDAFDLMKEAIYDPEIEGFYLDFVQTIHKIVLHIELSNPPLSLDLSLHSDRESKPAISDRYDLRSFKKADYYCIDGFPKENLPCVVILPSPMRAGYVYQGI